MKEYLVRWFGLVWFMVFNATFNNISVISWLSVLFVEEAKHHKPNQTKPSNQILFHCQKGDNHVIFLPFVFYYW
jgi:hypothetical protein